MTVGTLRQAIKGLSKDTKVEITVKQEVPEIASRLFDMSYGNQTHHAEIHLCRARKQCETNRRDDGTLQIVCKIPFFTN